MIINVSSVSYVLRAFPSCLTDRNDRAKALLLCLPRSHSLMYKTKGLLQSLLVSRRGSLKEIWSQKRLLKTEGQNLPLIRKLGLAKQVITVCLGCFFFLKPYSIFLKPATQNLKALRMLWCLLDCPTISPHSLYLLHPNLRPELRNRVCILNFFLYLALLFLYFHILAGSNVDGMSFIVFTLSPASLPDSDESNQQVWLNSTKNQFLNDVFPEGEGKLYLMFY